MKKIDLTLKLELIGRILSVFSKTMSKYKDI